MISVRAALAEDIPKLPAIEHRADEAYAAYPEFNGFEDACAVTPASNENLSDGAVVVVAEIDTALVGFIYGHPMDDCLYAAQLSVVPEAQNRGVGTQLLEAFVAVAQKQNQRGVTLITYAHLPFNAPFYIARGFHPLSDDEMGPVLAHKFEADAAKWGQYGPRVTMGLTFDD